MSIRSRDDVEMGIQRAYRRFISFKQLRLEHEHEKVKQSNPHRRMIQLTG
jgi:hypothetical protein